MPSACDSGGALGCATANIPWVIGVLAVLLVLLLAARLGLHFLEQQRNAPQGAKASSRPTPKVVAPGSPLQPTPPQPVKPTPLQLRVADAPDLRVTDFASPQTRGDFGEMLTDIILTGDGWKKLDSKVASGAGIGGQPICERAPGGTATHDDVVEAFTGHGPILTRAGHARCVSFGRVRPGGGRTGPLRPTEGAQTE